MFHQDVKLHILGQILSPSCDITGILLALQGLERLCGVAAVARAGQPTLAVTARGEETQKAWQPQLQLSCFSADKTKARFILFVKGHPASTSYLAWKHTTNACVPPCPKACFMEQDRDTDKNESRGAT